MGIDGAMREPTYFIVVALLDEPLHGYGVIKRVQELSQGRIRLAAGTLYAALDRLAAEGLLTVVREEVVNGRARRYYGVTDRGRAAAATEAERMASAAALVRDRTARTRKAQIRMVVKPA